MHTFCFDFCHSILAKYYCKARGAINLQLLAFIVQCSRIFKTLLLCTFAYTSSIAIVGLINNYSTNEFYKGQSYVRTYVPVIIASSDSISFLRCSEPKMLLDPTIAGIWENSRRANSSIGLREDGFLVPEACSDSDGCSVACSVESLQLLSLISCDFEYILFVLLEKR